MSKENDEKVVKEIIEYANNEIKKSKKKFTTILISVIAGIALIATAIFFAFAIEMPVPYTEGMVEVEIPEDEGTTTIPIVDKGTIGYVKVDNKYRRVRNAFIKINGKYVPIRVVYYKQGKHYSPRWGDWNYIN